MNLLKNPVLKYSAVALFGLVAFAVLLILTWHPVRGAQTVDDPAISNQFRVFETFASTTAESTTATSTNATSTNIVAYSDSLGRIIDGDVDIMGAKKIDVYFTRGGAFAAANTGTSTFSVQGTPDATWSNPVYVNRLLTSTTSPTSAYGAANGVYASDPSLGNLPTIGAIAPGNAATSTLHFIIDPTSLNYRSLRCISTRLVDGANSCKIVATF